MKGTRAAIRYAKAFKQLSEEKGLLDAVVTDMKSILAAISNSKELKMLLQSPLVKTDKKRAALAAVFNGKLNELTVSFVDQIASQGRENILEAICEETVRQYNELKNIAQVSVTTSTPLSEDLKADLLKNLKSKYNFSEIELEENINADLIGGMVLRIGDKQIDASIRRKLNDIKQELVH